MCFVRSRISNVTLRETWFIFVINKFVIYVTRRKAGWRKIVEIPFGMKGWFHPASSNYCKILFDRHSSSTKLIQWRVYILIIYHFVLGYTKVVRFYKTPWLIGFYVSLQLLDSKVVLQSWNNTGRHLTIALNMLIMAKYFVGLTWWHQKEVTGESLVMTIIKSVLHLLFFSVGWTESLRRAVKDLWIKTTFYPCQRRTLAVLSPTSFEKAGKARNIIARWMGKGQNFEKACLMCFLPKMLSSFWRGIYCVQLLAFSFHCFSGILFLSLCQLRQRILISSTPAH